MTFLPAASPIISRRRTRGQVGSAGITAVFETKGESSERPVVPACARSTGRTTKRRHGWPGDCEWTSSDGSREKVLARLVRQTVPERPVSPFHDLGRQRGGPLAAGRASRLSSAGPAPSAGACFAADDELQGISLRRFAWLLALGVLGLAGLLSLGVGGFSLVQVDVSASSIARRKGWTVPPGPAPGDSRSTVAETEGRRRGAR